MKSKNSKSKIQKFNSKSKTFYFLLIILTFAFCVLTFALRASAQSTMYNDLYKVRMGNLNSIAGESAGSGYNLNITSGELAPGLYSGANYKVRAGFQYINSIIPFSFTLSSQLIDFGTLSPTNPVTRTSTLTIDNQSAYGYVVTASENHQLLIPASGALIPDTTCDAGTCTESVGAAWASTLTYGFGYRCDNVSVIYNGSVSAGCVSGDTTFSSNPTYYKQFADASKSETAQNIMYGTSGRTQEATVTYKTNISSTQAPGLYTNAITYIAIPTY